MKKRFSFVFIALALLFSGSAVAGEIKAYDAQAFANAQASGKPILIEISAAWCPTCRAQKPVIEALAASPAHPDLIVFDVDFDSQKEVVRDFKAIQQSTLIAFKGKSETGRLVGVTDPEAIDALVAKAY